MVEDTVNRLNLNLSDPLKTEKNSSICSRREGYDGEGYDGEGYDGEGYDGEGTAVKDGSSSIRIAKRIFYYKIRVSIT
ncbi:MAG TPA: hypothetical protein VFD60_12420 [Nitrososphaeraceae archaeon]|jgi:hypothetical protein|nr:hypothetical protein [Nitrososphaeraceae archaeon]